MPSPDPDKRRLTDELMQLAARVLDVPVPDIGIPWHDPHSIHISGFHAHPETGEEAVRIVEVRLQINGTRLFAPDGLDADARAADMMRDVLEGILRRRESRMAAQSGEPSGSEQESLK